MDENKNNGELFGFDQDNSEENYNGNNVTSEGIDYQTNVAENFESSDDNQQHYAPHNEQFVFEAPVTISRKKKEKKYVSLSSLVISNIALLIVLAIIFSVIGYFGFDYLFNSRVKKHGLTGKVDVVKQNSYSLNVIEEDADAVVAVAKKVTTSVVGIRTTVSFYNYIYGKQESSGEGSGVIYSEDGYIITNYHVISDAVKYGDDSSEILVFINNGSEDGYPATVVGYNISYELAVIKINASGLTKIELADSSKLEVGHRVIAIGSPGGLQFMGSVTSGVISGLDRIISDENSIPLIQTDAAINPGNSGGALVNTKGELVGINSSKIVSESFEGMGFAIPTNKAVEICNKIIKKEYDPDPYIGININHDIDEKLLAQFKLPAGAYVYGVEEGGPADSANIKAGDIITEFNGKSIKNYTDLSNAISDCSPGNSVTVKIYRDGNYYTGTIVVGSNTSN